MNKTFKTKIKVSKTARIFYTVNDNDVKVKWMCIHGYGQLALYFIKKFEYLNKGHVFYSPEGLHRFYTLGFYGRVGASWMTKEDRLVDIKDNIEFLDQVNDLMKKNHSKAKLGLFSFSQGTATLIRFIYNKKIKPDYLIIWAGSLPPELEASEGLINLLIETKVFFVAGDQDEFIDEENYKINTRLMSTIAPHFKLVNYKGKHAIDVEILQGLLNKID